MGVDYEVAFEWVLTKETIHLPLGCLQGRVGGGPSHPEGGSEGIACGPRWGIEGLALETF